MSNDNIHIDRPTRDLLAALLMTAAILAAGYMLATFPSPSNAAGSETVSLAS
jgi:hypothetical protein